MVVHLVHIIDIQLKTFHANYVIQLATHAQKEHNMIAQHAILDLSYQADNAYHVTQTV